METKPDVPLNVTFSAPTIEIDDPTQGNNRRSHGSRASVASIGFSAQVKKRTCNGLFIDFLVRKSKTRVGKESIYSLIHDRDGAQEENGVSHNPAGLKVIYREELLESLRQEINAFWIDQEELTDVGSGALKQAAARLVKDTQRALCLKAEVQNWILKRKLLYSELAIEDKELETVHEKTERLNGFWKQYHSRPTKREGKTDVDHAPAPKRASVAPKRASIRRGTSVVQAPQKPQSPAVPGPPLFPPLGGKDPWKHRGAQGLHAHASCREDKPLAKFQSGLGKASTDLIRTKGPRADRDGHVSSFVTTSSQWRDGHGTAAKWRDGHGTAAKWRDGHGTTSKWRDGRSTMKQAVSLPELHNTNRGGGFSLVKNHVENHLGSQMREAVSLPDLHSTSRAREMNATQAKEDAFRRTRFEKRLPAIAQQFQEPWDANAGKSRKRVSPTQQYLKACEQSAVIPSLMPFVTGHSSKLHAAGKMLGDQDLLPVVAMLSSMNKIDELDLSGNVLLTEKSLVPLLTALFDMPAARSLEKLSLSGCLRNATRTGTNSTIETVTQLIGDDTVGYLEQLDLGHIAMGMMCHFPLCRAIQQHSCLSVVRLADIGLTGKIAEQCVDELMSCPMLQTLDLGWNCFTAEIFSNLGERLIGSKTLRKLCVANCSGAFSHGGDNPVQFLLEQLSRDTTLTNLDISMNRMDFRGALVLEDALNNSRTLQTLDISHNPLGVLGMRSVLRLLSRESCALIYITSKECSSSLEDDVAGGIQQFNATNPGGRYILNLHRPYHRALLRMFYRTGDFFKLSPDDTFIDIDFSNGKYQHAQKDSAGIWVVPLEGRLTVTFTIEKSMDVRLSDIEKSRHADPYKAYDFGEFLETQLSLMKVRPGYRKIIPMLAQWKSVEGRAKEETVILDALARDFQFTYPQIKQLCENRCMVNDIIWRIMPCLVGGTHARYLTSLLLPSAAELLQMLRRHRNLFGFNPQNPTGHYYLDLANPGDHSVAQDILLLDRWEAAIVRKMKSIDTSQRGNGSHVRNECYNDLPLFGHRSIAEWTLPESGRLEFDYSSGKRPPKDAVVLDEETFSSVLFVLERSEATPDEQLEPLRVISHRVWLTSLQLREMLGIYRQEETRADLYVMFIMQLVDMHNEKVFRVRFESRASLEKLRHRLGQAVFFPFIQPEQTWFEFDFSQYDQRLAANALMLITAKEGHSNLSQVTYVREDGSVDPLPLGVPKTWEVWEKMPVAGHFSGCYNCAPEDRNYKTRASLLESYALWKAPEKENEVTWWAILTETPPDVLLYLEFLVARYSDVFEAFKEIDGPDGNGQISLREFEEGVKEMNFKGFKEKHDHHHHRASAKGHHHTAAKGHKSDAAKEQDPEEKARQRVHAVFRYLDPSGEGQVSMEEWSILDLLFREIQLSIKEFVKFLMRSFGDDLDDAWEAFDEDGGGEIDFQEWKDALTEIGYFGPSRCIFSYLDKDGEGTISLDEFQALEDFQEKPDTPLASPGKRRRCTLASLSMMKDLVAGG